MKKIIIVFCFNLFLVHLFAQPEQIKGVFADTAIVVTAHPEASNIGLQILKNGGNAFDAAVAVEFALAVCYPAAGNIAGGGFLVYRLEDGSTGALDYREKAPALAHRNMYLDKDGNVLSNRTTEGCLSVGVPGTVAGMIEIHKIFGTLLFKDLIQPAIDLACSGVVLTEKEAAGLNKFRDSLLKYNHYVPHLVKNDGMLWQPGDTLKHIDLANTLERIRDSGRSGFYEGVTADLILEEMKAGGGIITREDLMNYKAVWRNPVVGYYKGNKIISMCPPSSGGIALIQLLGMVEKYDIGKFGFNKTKTIQVMVEAERRVYADRAAHLGDPDYYYVPVTQLLNNKYLESRMNNFSFEKATPSNEIKAGTFNDNESTETTHYTIVDAKWNAVVATTTLNTRYGSKVVVKGGGFLLNNQMDDFSIKPGFPNAYGLVGGEANAIAANKRMLSSMTPTIIEREGKLFMTVGTPGGSTIITSVFQTVLNVLEHKMTAQDAVNARRFHHQWLPDEITAEDNAFDDYVLNELTKLGYKIKNVPEIGRVEAVMVLPDGRLEGAADPRGDDKAVGY
ncbi:MAG: gamma-glutamyltransferase [Bacteroidetes bacterium]|nr:gamma-glutamyltransferase [Bacteroidota bacterium]